MNNQNPFLTKLLALPNVVLALLGGVLMCAGWSIPILLPFIFISLIPLIALFHKNRVGTAKSGVFWRYTYLLLFIWNLGSTWWIYNSTAGGAAAAIICNALLMSLPLLVSRIIAKKFSMQIGIMYLPLTWIIFEKIHMHWDLSWSWLNLGNSFALFPPIAFPFAFTGALGGTALIWIVNLSIYGLLLSPIKKRLSRSILLVSTIFWGIFIALFLILYPSNDGKPIEIVVMQPNINPYTEKFIGSENYLPIDQQISRFISISESQITDSTVFLLWPETALANPMAEANLEEDPIIIQLKSWLTKHPNLTLITGATTDILYTPQNKTPTSRRVPNSQQEIYYDIFNTALRLKGDEPVQVYHKSKLVPGVEQLPYPAFFSFLSIFEIDLGGVSGCLGTQPERESFQGEKGARVAPVICYESIYGQFIGDFFKQKANFIGIITNDGWWGNTPGHRQHFSYASLRSIEQHKSVARAANTGISGFIDTHGQVYGPTLDWEKQGALRNTIYINDTITPYNYLGDFIWILSSISLLCLTVVGKRRKLGN
jgi:apolipoprotein N-acyltransferase